MAVSQSVIPAAAGIGLRTPHLASLACTPPVSALTPAWVEIHSETFLCDGGPRLAMLDAVAAQTPVSCHGVGLSLGSAEGLDKDHLARLKRLFNRVRPGLVSEHLAWSVTGGVYLNDLLPLPMTEASLATLCRNVNAAQDAFGRKILVENPSTYVGFPGTAMSEPEFIATLVDRTGCGLLIDINNVYVSAANSGFDAETYLKAIPAAAVGEIHLAGHVASGSGDARLLVDTHSARISDPVWTLYAATIARIGARPTLIEWDADLPELSALLQEAGRAQSVLDGAAKRQSHVA